MKKITSFLLVFLSLSGFAEAAEPQFRFLFHPTKKVGENGWGVAGWSVTNIGKGGFGNEVLVGGLRYQNQKLWTEFMPCAVISYGQTKPCFDTRTNVQLSDHVNIWFEIQAFSNLFYWFAESDYSRDWWLIGVETENVHMIDRSSWGFGPHVKFKIAKGLWAGPAYQFRQNEPDVLRLYVVFHLPG